MHPVEEVVITGVGVVSPNGIGRDAYWRALCDGRSGVHALSEFAGQGLPVEIGGEVADFDPKQYITPRKSLKVMSRVIQLGVTAAELARRDALLEPGTVDPERFGVVMGSDTIYLDPEELSEAYQSCVEDGSFRFDHWGQRALGEMYPLWMLKYLPNMPACHIAIAHDARGPNNTIALAEVSSLLAIAEAMRVIERGQADVMITGGTGSRIHPLSWIFRDVTQVSQQREQPERASRPFDVSRDGMVYGEGAAAFILESRRHATARRAKVFGRLVSYASTFSPPSNNGVGVGVAVEASINQALSRAGLSAADLGHVNAHGLSTVVHDRVEAQAIRNALGDVPVTATKSFFGNLGAGTGAVEMAASLIGMNEGMVPQTINVDRLDPDCPINVVCCQNRAAEKRMALLLNQASTGQAVAVVIEAEECPSGDGAGGAAETIAGRIF